MILYGGFDNKNLILEDTYCLDLETMTWFMAKISNKSAKPGGLSHHTLTAVYP
jgi:hypothetical protein